MLTSYHVHSKLSDGQTTIPELAQAAVEAGIDELGVSDHYVLLPGGETVDWGMPLDALSGYVEEIRRTAEEFHDRIIIRCGLEADFMPTTVDELGQTLKAYPFDYVIGSVHFVDGFPIDECAEKWDALSRGERDDVIRAYWNRVADMADSELFDFAGHLDLYKKFGHKPSVDITEDIAAALDAIARSGMAVEINTAGWYLPAGEAYPSAEILVECRKRGIPVLITADAHNPANLTRGFERARELVRETGYTSLSTFANREMRPAGM